MQLDAQFAIWLLQLVGQSVVWLLQLVLHVVVWPLQPLVSHVIVWILQLVEQLPGPTSVQPLVGQSPTLVHPWTLQGLWVHLLVLQGSWVHPLVKHVAVCLHPLIKHYIEWAHLLIGQLPGPTSVQPLVEQYPTHEHILVLQGSWVHPLVGQSPVWLQPLVAQLS